MWKNLLKHFSRIFTGATFVFSGFVKAVDPVGGAVKFNDYFQAFHMDWFMPMSMPFSIGLATLEFLIGIFLVLNIFPRRNAIVAFVFMVFFTILTLGLAIFNPISDCGCFGDAIKLTNWQTFWKNIVILIFATVLFVLRKEITSPFSKLRQLTFYFLMLFYILGVAAYSLEHLPIIDFRPYATGTHIPSGMSIPEDAPQPEYETTFILEKDGKRKEFTEDNYPYEDSTWVFIESKTKVIQEGYQPPLQDFILQHPEQGNITDQLINQSEPLFLVISPSLQEIDEKQAMKLAEFQQSSRQDGLDFYIVTSSTSGQISRFNDQSPTEFDFLLGDETNLKTIIRSNPGMLLIINGTIAGKWHYNDLPPVKAAGQPLSFALTQQQNHKTFLLLMVHAFVIALAAFLILFQFRKTQNNKKQ